LLQFITLYSTEDDNFNQEEEEYEDGDQEYEEDDDDEDDEYTGNLTKDIAGDKFLNMNLDR
jgi:hypothetical protein